MKTNHIRKIFLDYFKKNGHKVLPSSSLIPTNDPTLLFTNAGMVQFKDVFLGQKERPSKCAATAQRCVRVGGKHNDLENVGYTARHHTFFEMLGNFSFGDYFKKEAIAYSWDFLTKTLKLPPEKLWISIYKDDEEAADIWLKEIKVDPKRFSRCGEKDNFWSMGDTGPCGPCSEVFYDHGPEIVGGPPGSPDQEGDRYVEIWNLVFMQFNRDSQGQMSPLPKPSVDTGMGLERIAAVMQGVHSNYDIDIFQNLIQATAKLAKTKDLEQASLKVIADHIRSTAFLIADGVTPSNEGRGYVLRRIIRRAIRHGHKLGIHDIFFYRLVATLCQEMGEAYPELNESKSHIEKILQREEKKFVETLDQGLKIFERELKSLSKRTIPGDVVFKLYDTYGFPPDLTADIAREKNLFVNMDDFNKKMKEQQERSLNVSSFFQLHISSLPLKGETKFTGYESLSDQGVVTQLVKEDQLVDSLKVGDKGIVILDKTPFYAEAGGQVGDMGHLYFKSGYFNVVDTKKQGKVYLHYGSVEKGQLKVGDHVDAEVDSARNATVLNHSATHLLHAALRQILGEHVLQKGSLVAPERLRFDFSHFEPMAKSQIYEVERLVNRQIRANLHCRIEFMSPEEAVKKGAIALFDEKYGDKVRVLSMGEFSKELCGGTHVEYTGEVGFFKIISETGIAGGIRRIEALTGEKALEWVEKNEKHITSISELLKTNPHKVVEKLELLLKQMRDQEKQLKSLKDKFISSKSSDLVSKAVRVGDFNVLATQLDGDVNALRHAMDELKQQLRQGVIVLAAVNQGKIQLIAGVNKAVVDKIKAKDLLQFVAKQVGGKGGGRPDLAQGGGTDVSALPKALDSVVEWVKQFS